MSTPAIPLPCTANQARVALGEASKEINEAYGVVAGFDGDTTGITNMLDVAAASTNGLYAMVPSADLNATISDDLQAKIQTSLTSTAITLDTVSAEAGNNAQVSWDLGGAINGLMGDVGDALGSLGSGIGNGLGNALKPIADSIIPLLVVVGVLLILIFRTGALKVGI